MKQKNLIALIACIAIPVLTGALAGFATSSNRDPWYANLDKPWFNPPGWIFGPVWTLLYILMGISLFMIWKQPGSKERSTGLRLFALQLVLNFAWSFIFFYFHNPGLALLEILVLWLVILLMIRSFYRLNHLATYLQIPYQAWVSFATVLNASIWYLNR